MDKIPESLLTVDTITLGCKVNQFESDAISAAFHNQKPLSQCGKIQKDLIVINTCTVTSKAAMQSRQAIRRAIRENPGAIVVATGCYAQSEPQALKKINGLDYIIDNSEKHRIAEIFSGLCCSIVSFPESRISGYPEGGW